jgi:hypothetical protein
MIDVGTNNSVSMRKRAIINQRKPRICMLTTRNFEHNAWRCSPYEAQDVLSEVDDVDLLNLVPLKAYKLRESFQRDLIWHDFTKMIVSMNMAYHSIRLREEYDLFIAYLPYQRDLIHVPAIRGWKDHCKTSICWIDEFWATNVPYIQSWLSALGQFDYVALGLKGTVKPVSNAIGKACHFVPAAVDAMRFTPYPIPPARVIDIYSFGRILEGFHHAFLDVSAKNGLFYVYDTFHAADAPVKDHRQHREMFANMAKRSRFLVVQPAKAGVVQETMDQIEVGYRFYEASAAGAVMVGQTPRCESFDTMFDWPDAVIEIKPDGSDASDVISGLAAQPKRLIEISRRNAVEALLRHDWVYRWEQILNIVGLKPTEQMEIRKKRLKQMAENALNG